MSATPARQSSYRYAIVRRLVLSASVLVALVGSTRSLTPGPARAEGSITVVSSEASVQFPTTVTFTLVAASPGTITSVGLAVNTPGKSYGAIPLDVHPAF